MQVCFVYSAVFNAVSILKTGIVYQQLMTKSVYLNDLASAQGHACFYLLTTAWFELNLKEFMPPITG